MNTAPASVAFISTITVKTTFTALHRWKDAPDETFFLRDYHRHVFHVEASVFVAHNDRQVEFFHLQKKLANYCSGWRDEQLDMSCEMFAEEIGKRLLADGYRPYKVSVSEDGENAAVLYALYEGQSGPMH